MGTSLTPSCSDEDHMIQSRSDTDMTTATLAFLLCQSSLYAAYANRTGLAKAVKIHAEDSYRVDSPHALADAAFDVVDRLALDETDFDEAWTVWLFDPPSLDALGLRTIASMAASGQGGATAAAQRWLSRQRWLCLASDWLDARLAEPLDPSRPQHWLTQVVIPWLRIAQADADLAQARVALEHAHRDEAMRLAAEREALERENALLREQNAALRAIDLERLITYLPALYEHVFTTVSPTDLALLCGRLELPNMPNPWPEPASETLRQLQEQFRSLPAEVQRQILDFAERLPQSPRLKPRAEMRESLHQLRKRAVI